MAKSSNVIRACYGPIEGTRTGNWSVFWEYKKDSGDLFADKCIDKHFVYLRETPQNQLVVCEWDQDEKNGRGDIYRNPEIHGIYTRYHFANNRMAKVAGEYACSLMERTGHQLELGTGRILDLPEAKEFFRECAKEFLKAWPKADSS
jgi:hypothetical protein